MLQGEASEMMDLPATSDLCGNLAAAGLSPRSGRLGQSFTTILPPRRQAAIVAGFIPRRSVKLGDLRHRRRTDASGRALHIEPARNKFRQFIQQDSLR